MRVLVLNYEFPPLGGGAANATFYLLKEFAGKKNIRIDLVTSSTSSFRKEKFASNITIHYLDIRKNVQMHYQSMRELLTYSWKAFFYARRLKFDVTHAFFGIPCGFIAMLLGKPYIVSLRGSDVPFYSKRFYWLDTFLFSWLSRIVWRRSKDVVANSESLKSLALQTAPRQLIKVIPNGINTSFFTPGSRPRKGVLAVGRLIERKGFDLLIKACKGMQLTIAGDGPELEKLRALDPSVNFVGNVDRAKLLELYQTHSIFCLPSSAEGMSNTVLEAMACGMPLVVTSCSSELVSGNGFVVDRTVSALSNALHSKSDWAILGARSREIAENMSWGKVASKYSRLYN